jgi:dipeptidyl aminopeptidase/acylaminoacyl peptidase
MFRTVFILSCILIGSLGLLAQPPATQLYVFDMQMRDSAILLSEPRFLTSFNPDGYNNQPSWIGRNTLYASVATPGMAQPDIYSFDLAARTRRQLTATESGEYSPKRTPEGSRFTAIRQEYLERDTVLRLWEFPVGLENNGRPVFTDRAGMGYYEWLNNSQLALYMVDEQELVMASVNGAAPRTIASQTGRTFTRLSNGNLVYVDKSVQPYRLMEKNLYELNRESTVIAPMLEGTEDFTVLPDGSFLAGSGDRLYRLRPREEKQWRPVVELSTYNLGRISRLTYNGQDKIAIVAER